MIVWDGMKGIVIACDGMEEDRGRTTFVKDSDSLGWNKWDSDRLG